MTAETFDFDTSGEVLLPAGFVWERYGSPVQRWSDLSPFAQGYIRAAFAAWIGNPDFWANDEAAGYPDKIGFSDLHPDTLESMLADCANFRPVEGSEPDDVKRIKGGMFWRYRQDGAYARDGFPPLRLSLDPNGKVIAEHG